jgi:hypothetical protein
MGTSVKKSAHGTRRRPTRDTDHMEVKLREGTNDDAAVCGRICYEVFSDISWRHGYSSFFASLEEGTKVMSYLLSATGFYTFIAEVSLSRPAIRTWSTGASRTAFRSQNRSRS